MNVKDDEEAKETIPHGIQDWMLEQKKDISGKLVRLTQMLALGEAGERDYRNCLNCLFATFL